jgi:hypothetical protein
METMLESGLLDEMDDDVLQELCGVIAKKQEIRLGVSRDGSLVNEAVGKWGDWLALQDIPQPRVRQPYKPRVMRSPKITPVDASVSTKRRSKRGNSPPPGVSPMMSPEVKNQAQDDIFTMDEESTASPLAPSGRQTPRSSRPMTPLDLHAPSSSKTGVPWKSKTVESRFVPCQCLHSKDVLTSRVDLRSIMAETQASAPKPRPPPAMIPGTRPDPSPSAAAFTPPRASGGAPWRAVEVARPSLSAVQASQVSSPSVSSITPGSLPRTVSASATPQTTPAQRGLSSSSKVFTPTKIPSASSITRKASR